MMTSLLPGARVYAVRDIFALLRVGVPAGTSGTVEQIQDYGTIVVRFDNGRRLGVSASFLSVAAQTPAEVRP